MRYDADGFLTDEWTGEPYGSSETCSDPKPMISIASGHNKEVECSSCGMLVTLDEAGGLDGLLGVYRDHRDGADR